MEIEKVAPDAKFIDLGADSLDTVEIMMALEEKFDIQFSEEGAEKNHYCRRGCQFDCRTACCFLNISFL